MGFDEKKPKPRGEDIVMTYACLLWLRQSPIELEELLFLHEAIEEQIKTYKKDVH